MKETLPVYIWCPINISSLHGRALTSYISLWRHLPLN